jgi:hypothetical protein
MQTYEEVKVQLCTFLTSALDGGEWSVSHFGHRIRGGRSRYNHWLGG